MVTTEPDEATGQLQHAEVVLALLLPAYQNAPTHRQPGQCPLDHPAPGGMLLGTWRSLVPFEGNMWNVIVVQTHAVAGIAVIALIECQVLLIVLINRRSLQDDGLDRRVEQLRIRHVRASNRDAEWSTIRFDD